jgi:hypothetical protein
MITSRRKILEYMATTPIALGTMSSILPIIYKPVFANVTPNTQIGSITGNDPVGYLNYAKWFGRKPQLALLAFNQSNASALSSSISYMCQQAEGFMADGAQILWSVPCPGAKQLEAIVAGSYDSLYTNLFQSILAVSLNSTRILVRLPWEFNLGWQENAAIDRNGNVNCTLFINAWIRIASIAKNVSPYFYRIWCPNVTTMSLDPINCWPGAKYVEYISQDFYMQSAYNKAGDFSWFLNEARGLKWCSNFAVAQGKRYGLSEWGMDSDVFVGDLNSTAAWLASLGNNMNHHCWWDRSDVIDCSISDGSHPGLAAAYKKQFY